MKRLILLTALLSHFTFAENDWSYSNGKDIVYFKEENNSAKITINNQTYSLESKNDFFESKDSNIKVKQNDNIINVSYLGTSKNYTLNKNDEDRILNFSNDNSSLVVIINKDYENAIIKIDGKKYNAKLTKSASGVKYQTDDKNISVHIKANFAVLRVNDSPTNYKKILKSHHMNFDKKKK